jgi:predicted DNA-binding transcriptional regulator AlpA
MSESETNPFPDTHYTQTELARKLGRSKRTLWRWESRGVAPPKTVLGRLVLYKKSSVEDWLAQQERRPGRKRAASVRK